MAIREYVPPEKLEGTWHGKPVSMNRTMFGHTFTDDEFQDLCDGKTIHFDAHSSKTGNDYVAIGALADREYNGREYVGWEFRDVPYQWGGHVFTDDEVERLHDGEEIDATDCVSRKTGKNYEAYLSLVDEGGRKRIECRFPAVPHEFQGHTFTDKERADLEGGKTLHVTDLVSKRTGKTYAANLSVEDDENGNPHLKMSFDD